MDENFMNVWAKALDILKDEMSQIAFKTYIEVIVPRLVDKNTVCLLCPSSYYIDTVKTRYLELIRNTLNYLTSVDYKITFEEKVVVPENEETNLEDVEIVSIDKSNLNIIGTEINKIINSISSLDESSEIYLDFTGGTKLQSAFIREYFENNIDTKKDTLTLVYVDGYEKTIKLKDKATSKEIEVCFDDIDGADDEDEMIKICKLHGYSIEIKSSSVKAIRDDGEFSCNFDDVYMKGYNLEFASTLQYELGEKDSGKGKVKLEIFKNIIHSEQIGGSFANLDLIVPEAKEEKYRKLMNEFLGIKKNIYKDRISFNQN